MADPTRSATTPSPGQLYVCENCGLLGHITDFNEDCTPGWTHGKLIRIEKQAAGLGYDGG